MNQPPTSFTKAVICIEKRLEHELHAKMALFSARRTIHNNFDHKSETFHSKIQMPPIMKSVSLEKAINFCIGRILSV
jgi:murein tripeptide amidase MpaA